MQNEKPSEGFFWCGHCNHVVVLDPELDVAQTFKCPRCKKWAVRWRFPSRPSVKEDAKPVSPARASELCAAMFAVIEGGGE